ncbi:MAG TPA: TIGR03435 family protein [Phycisphaerae bacterium]|nr:TIGR03435 family protein [Phycisphaerae bacterium]
MCKSRRMCRFLAASLFLFVCGCERTLEKEKSPVGAARVRASAGGLQIGSPAPPLGLETLLQAPQGATASWEALRGKAVVLEFWATWCGPCVAAIPHLNELAEKYAGKPVQFIAVTAEPESKVAPFLERKAIRAWVGLDTDKSMHAAYGIEGIPLTVLVDAQGKLAGFTHPMGLTAGLLDDLIAGKPLPSVPESGNESDTVSARGAEEESGAPPLFEITIRRGAAEGMTSSSAGMLTMKGADLPQVLSTAYGWPRHQIDIAFAVPEEYYDVEVRVPRAQDAALRPMLQQALEATFGLRTRREPRTVAAYALTVPKGATAKLTPAAAPDGGQATQSGAGSMEFVNVSPGNLAASLAELLQRPVFNETQLNGRYDVSLRWDESKPDGLLAAVREQLGLELTPVERPVEMLVVEKTPHPQVTGP